nr:hypothetical protein [Nocardia gipuzkoensis]
MTEHNARHKVVVIGGGYAGTLAANHLRMRTDVDITLVNPRPTFIDRIRLHQFVSGTGDAAVDYGTLLGEGIDLALIGTCISLGRHAGIRQLARKDDTAVSLYLGGRVGARIKEVTCKIGIGKIRREARKPGSLIWPKGGPRPAQPAGAAPVVTSS